MSDGKEFKRFESIAAECTAQWLTLMRLRREGQVLNEIMDKYLSVYSSELIDIAHPSDGLTALHCACQFEDEARIVMLMIRYSANITIRDKVSVTEVIHVFIYEHEFLCILDV